MKQSLQRQSFDGKVNFMWNSKFKHEILLFFTTYSTRNPWIFYANRKCRRQGFNEIHEWKVPFGCLVFFKFTDFEFNILVAFGKNYQNHNKNHRLSSLVFFCASFFSHSQSIGFKRIRDFTQYKHFSRISVSLRHSIDTDNTQPSQFTNNMNRTNFIVSEISVLDQEFYFSGEFLRRKWNLKRSLSDKCKVSLTWNTIFFSI